MIYLDRVVAVLTRHREARHWTDDAVARELCAELAIDPKADAPASANYPDPPVDAVAEAIAAEHARHAEALATIARDAEAAAAPVEPVAEVSPAADGLPASESDAERNGMTEAEWDALPEPARAWRRDHPRIGPAGPTHALPAEPSTTL